MLDTSLIVDFIKRHEASLLSPLVTGFSISFGQKYGLKKVTKSPPTFTPERGKNRGFISFTVYLVMGLIRCHDTRAMKNTQTKTWYACFHYGYPVVLSFLEHL